MHNSRHGVVVCRDCRHEVELEQLSNGHCKCRNCAAVYMNDEIPALRALKTKIDAAKSKLDEAYQYAPTPKN